MLLRSVQAGVPPGLVSLRHGGHSEGDIAGDAGESLGVATLVVQEPQGQVQSLDLTKPSLSEGVLLALMGSVR